MDDEQRGPSTGPTPALWFGHAPDQETRRRNVLTRERVVAEALTAVNADGIEALSMRSLATRLDVVPGALYRHVRNKEQLYDLVLDEILAEVDLETDPATPWTERVTTLAHRLRTALEAHPGMAGLLKRRAPLTPHSLALAEAFLQALDEAGLPPSGAAMAYHLVHDYAVGFALSDRASVSEQRVEDPATRQQLRMFLRSLPVEHYPRLAASGELVWIDDRDERFGANLLTLVRGLQSRGHPPARS
jgi:AcrR family transcriptional regulator